MRSDTLYQALQDFTTYTDKLSTKSAVHMAYLVPLVVPFSEDVCVLEIGRGRLKEHLSGYGVQYYAFLTGEMSLENKRSSISVLILTLLRLYQDSVSCSICIHKHITSL